MSSAISNRLTISSRKKLFSPLTSLMPLPLSALLKGLKELSISAASSAEAPWETILRSNIIGTHNLFEAARKQGVKRVVFASSNHAVGFYPRAQRIGPQVLPLPDTRYGVSKAFGESLGALYAYKYGLGVFCIRIGNVSGAPAMSGGSPSGLSPRTLFHSFASVLNVKASFMRWSTASRITHGRWDNSRASELGYQPEGHSEDFANQALAAQAGLPSDEIGDLFQGGSFCSLEFEAPLSRVAPKD